jgi:peptidoglycan biosynthesis protein MviN/MurJ (putative lipid II flippase)
MSTPASSLTVAAPPAPATTTIARGARAGAAMSIATFAMAAASAIQAVLYLSRFGTDGRTDGFFVAFAIYTTFGVFSQSLRLTSVPLLVEPGARLTVREYAAALAIIAVPVLIATVALAPLLADLLAPGLSASDRAVTASALPILGGAMVLQLWAAGGATVLAIRGRFATVAGSYMAGAAAGLATFLGLMDRTNELVLGWSMLAMAIVTMAWMTAGLRASGGLGVRGPRRRLLSRLRDPGLLLANTAIYLAFNMLFVFTLAFASHSAVGDATVLSYAYLFASYLVAGTGMALGMSRIPDMTRMARAEQRAVVGDTVPQGFRYSILLVAPLLAALIVAGAPLVHRLFPGSLSADGVHTLRVLTALLVPWTVGALLVNFLLPALFAGGRSKLVNWLAPGLVVLHLAATAAGNALFGIEGAVAAFAVAPCSFAAVLLIAGAGRDAGILGREICLDAARFLGVAAVAFGLGALAGAALPAGLAAATGAGLVGAVAYALGLAVVARKQMRVLTGTLLRPATT